MPRRQSGSSAGTRRSPRAAVKASASPAPTRSQSARGSRTPVIQVKPSGSSSPRGRSIKNSSKEKPNEKASPFPGRRGRSLSRNQTNESSTKSSLSAAAAGSKKITRAVLQKAETEKVPRKRGRKSTTQKSARNQSQKKKLRKQSGARKRQTGIKIEAEELLLGEGEEEMEQEEAQKATDDKADEVKPKAKSLTKQQLSQQQSANKRRLTEEAVCGVSPSLRSKRRKKIPEPNVEVVVKKLDENSKELAKIDIKEKKLDMGENASEIEKRPSKFHRKFSVENVTVVINKDDITKRHLLTEAKGEIAVREERTQKLLATSDIEVPRTTQNENSVTEEEAMEVEYEAAVNKSEETKLSKLRGRQTANEVDEKVKIEAENRFKQKVEDKIVEETEEKTKREATLKDQKDAEERAQTKREEEKMKKEAEENTKREAAEEKARREAAEEEKARREAAEEEKARREAAEEEKARKEFAEEKARKEAAEEEKARKEAAEEEKAKREAAEEKARREAAEEKAKREAAEEKAKREAAEEKARKEVAAEEEKARKETAAEEEKARKEAAAEEEKARKEAAAEEEKARKEAAAEEERARKEAAAEEEKARKEAAAEEEKARKEAAAEEEKARKEAAAEEEKARKEAAAEEEKAREKAAAEEKARKEAAAEEEKARKEAAAEEEKARKEAAAEEEKARKEAAAEEEKARKEAAAEEEKARKEAAAEEEKARKEAAAEEEKAREKAAAEEKARKEAAAEEKAREKAAAEENARKEEAEKSAKEAKERDKKEAVVKERAKKEAEEAERVKKIEQKVREAAEEKARREVVEKARKEAEEIMKAAELAEKVKKEVEEKDRTEVDCKSGALDIKHRQSEITINVNTSAVEKISVEHICKDNSSLCQNTESKRNAEGSSVSDKKNIESAADISNGSNMGERLNVKSSVNTDQECHRKRKFDSVEGSLVEEGDGISSKKMRTADIITSDNTLAESPVANGKKVGIVEPLTESSVPLPEAMEVDTLNTLTSDVADSTNNIPVSDSTLIPPNIAKQTQIPSENNDPKLVCNPSAKGLGNADKDRVNFCDSQGGCAGDILLSRKLIHNPVSNRDSTDMKRQFSVVSYNILADCHFTKKHVYPEEELHFLELTSRHKRLMHELRCFDADILCLQEVAPEYYGKILSPDLHSLGYEGFFKKRVHDDYDEGEATFYKTSRFTDAENTSYSLKQLLEKDIQETSLGIDEKTAIRQFLNRPDVLLVTRLKCRNTGTVVTVGNIHVIWAHCKFPNIQCVQIASAIKEVVSRAGNVCNPHIICGDFNSAPWSPGYQLATEGYLTTEMIQLLQSTKSLEMPDGSKTSLVNHLWNGFQHTSSNLKSAYFTVQGKEPDISTYTIHVDHCVDYIFYSSGSLDSLAVLQLPDKETILSQKIIPNRIFPSDHLSIKAVLAFK